MTRTESQVDQLLAPLDAWLATHPDRFASPIHPLIAFVRRSVRECDGLPTISQAEYEDYLARNTHGPGLPFATPALSIPATDSIEAAINAVDGALLDRMVHDHLLGLLRHLSEREGGCAFMDYGTGPSCGLHGREHAALYPKSGIDVGRVTFVGIDKFVKPANAVFPRARYARADLVTFRTDERFDLASAHHVLEHLRDWKALLAAFARVLKPGGYAFLSFPDLGGFYDVAYRLITRTDHVATYQTREVIATAEAAGFELVLCAPYADPRMAFFWMPSAEPLVTPALQRALYECCVFVGARTRLYLHPYGRYLVLRVRSGPARA